ncbi:MAG: GAF domain-containing protein [Betaproteobacteria bacterium]
MKEDASKASGSQARRWPRTPDEGYPLVRSAVRQAHFYEQLAALARQAVDLTDPQELLQRAPAMAARAIGCEASLVFLVEPSHLELRVVSAFGLSSERTAGQRVPNRGDSVAGWVVEQQGVVIVPDWAQEQRFEMPEDVREQGLHSALAAPLFDKGQVVGVLSMGSSQTDFFTQEEVRFVQAVANVLATSLQRAQMEAQLRQAHKMESVGQLTGGIAHDFNNLLTVIQGNLQMAQEHLKTHADEHGLELLRAASGASRRAADLTGKLLAFSRRQLLTPSRVELGELLPSLVDLLRRTLGEKIEIVVNVVPRCPPCLADKFQLESALLNIAINARDAMPQGGRLSFTCSAFFGLADELAPAQTGRASQGGSPWVCISVTDNGSGMTSAVRERAFEPFFTTKEAGRGTGLGLSSVYGFVRQSSGSITLDSAPGMGTTVTMLLPAFEGAAPVTALPLPRQSLPGGLRVLLVEDDAEVRAVARRFLESLECQVWAHASAEAASADLGTGIDFDLLLTDIELGSGIKGTEFARRVRALRPNLPVLLTSGYSDHVRNERHQEPGRWPLLKKPFSREELAAAASLALGGGT